MNSMTNAMDQILDLDIFIDLKDLENECFKILSIVRSGWNPTSVKYQTIEGGFLNRIVLASVGEDLTDAVMFRVYEYRDGYTIDKGEEKTTTRLLSDVGVSPRIYCIFTNGVCYQYAQGTTYTWTDFTPLDDVKIAKSMAHELAKLHSNTTYDLAVNKYHKKKQLTFLINLDNLIDNLPSDINSRDPEFKKMWFTMLPTKESFRAERRRIANAIEKMDLTLEFCHNDAHPANIVYQAENGKSILLDYDLAGIGYGEYDLAAFLHMCTLGFTKVGSHSLRVQPEYRKDVLREYLHCKRDLGNVVAPVTDADIDVLYTHVRTFMLIASLVYTLFSATHAVHIDCDYLKPIDFLRRGLEEHYEWYRVQRDQILALSEDNAKLWT